MKQVVRRSGIKEVRKDKPKGRPAAHAKRNSAGRKPKATRWAEILDAAAEIFFEKGYDASSLQDIADRVGILKGSVYYYIETKQDLLSELLREVHAVGLAHLRRSMEVEGSSLDKLRSMIGNHVIYICRNLARTTVYLHELGQLSPEERKDVVADHEYRNVFMDVIGQAQDEGLILRDLDLKLTAQIVLSSINSVYGWYQPTRGRSAQVVADHVALTTLRGLATEKGVALLAAPFEIATRSGKSKKAEGASV